MKIDEQLSLADESEEYKAFVEKFKPKKTTDDCYTPENIHEIVIQWVEEKYGRDRSSFVRPFWPGGDYKREEYPDGCVVVDNPPFSILSEIMKFYEAHDVDYFLYAPTLTLFGSNTNATHVVCNAAITYENGAEVNTSFNTSLERGIAFKTEPRLRERIKVVNKENIKKQKKQLPKYNFPYEVATAAHMGYLAAHGEEFSVKRTECVRIASLDSMKAAGKAIFGGGYLLSERAAAERAAAERAAAERAAAERGIETWTLSEREKKLQAMLGEKEAPND